MGEALNLKPQRMEENDLSSLKFDHDCFKSKVAWAQFLLQRKEYQGPIKSADTLKGRWSEAYRYLILQDKTVESINEHVALDILYEPLMDFIPYLSFSVEFEDHSTETVAIALAQLLSYGRDGFSNYMPSITSFQDSKIHARLCLQTLHIFQLKDGKFEPL